MERLCSWPSWISARTRSHSRKALRGRLGHQITGTTARPFLHFLNPTRRPRRVSSRLVSWRVLRSCVLAPTRSRRSAPRLASSARVVWYLMVMRQQPMALHARRSLIPDASRRWTTAFRFPAGITTSFPLGSSAPRCPAWHALKVAKASKCGICVANPRQKPLVDRLRLCRSD